MNTEKKRKKSHLNYYTRMLSVKLIEMTHIVINTS